ncbi:MAG: glycosyltransferase family 2 protein [Candidatus Levybacteria bacterium]|nr:glycosyltransferase family 2 protein [Candidatus Levybacteria bacterium]
MTTPTICVVIAAYNEEKYLPKTLESLENQTDKDFSVIVVDNNSTDQTAAIAKKYGAKVIKEERQGVVFALNAGMHEAKSDVIAMTDADTTVLSNWVASIRKRFEDNRIVGATGSIKLEGPLLYRILGSFFYNVFLIIHEKIAKPHLIGFNFAVRKDTFEKIGGMNERYTMSPDVEVGLRLKELGKVVFIRDMVVVPNMRRFKSGLLKTIYEYGLGYVYTIWLRRPPPVKQKVIRNK